MRKPKYWLSLLAILSLVVGTIMSITTLSSATLVETVLYESTSPNSKTASATKVGSWFQQVRPIRADVQKNGVIHPSEGEYYKVVVTGKVSEGTSTLYMGENVSWDEYHGDSGILTTEESTVTLTVCVPIWGVEGEIYVCDTGLAGHTIEWSYLKVSVFRDKDLSKYNTLSLYGDAHLDSVVDIKDVLAVRKYLGNIGPLDEFNIKNADANNDSFVDMKDVLAIRKHVAQISMLPSTPTQSTTQGPTTTTTKAIHPEKYNDTPDQITLAFLDKQAKDIGITWHTYNEGGTHVAQYMEKTTETPDFSKATSIVAETTEYSSLTMPYDLETNLFRYGYDITTVKDYSHKASLTNLKYNTTYIYRVGDPDKNIWSETGSFTTKEESSNTFSFVEFSDTQVGVATDITPYHYMYDAISGALQDNPNPAFLMNGGDFVQCSKYLHLWRNQLNGNKTFLMNHVLMPVTGNHDSIYDTAGDTEIYKHFNIQVPIENNVLRYGIFYSYDYANAHFIVLNTDCFKSSGGALDDVQLNWLKSDLENNQQEWTIVVLHRPLFAIRQIEESANKSQLLSLFNEAGVDLVIQSHEHVYMRSYPIDENESILSDSPIRTENDIDYFVNPEGVLFVTCATAGLDGKPPIETVSKDFCHTYGDGHASSWGDFTIDNNKLTVSVKYYDEGIKEYENGTWGIIKEP